MQALVTGGTSRIGRAIVAELEKRGARVAVHYRKTRPAGEGLFVQGDQAKEPDRIVGEAVERLGGLDLLVCNAAEFEKVPATELSAERFDWMLQSNLVGPFRLMQAAYPHLKTSKGSIVTVLDLCGTSQVWKGYAHYAASKAGLATLTKLLALEWAPDVRVNGVAPGAIDVDDERLVKRIPLGRIGTPEDVARSVVFLAGEPFMTGQILTVDGGRSVNP
jgi:pteridine reductase